MNCFIKLLKINSEGKYVKHWLKELAKIPAKKVHQPWQLTLEEQKKYSVIIGADYPHPIVDLEKSVHINEEKYKKALELFSKQ